MSRLYKDHILLVEGTVQAWSRLSCGLQEKIGLSWIVVAFSPIKLLYEIVATSFEILTWYFAQGNGALLPVGVVGH